MKENRFSDKDIDFLAESLASLHKNTDPGAGLVIVKTIVDTIFLWIDRSFIKGYKTGFRTGLLVGIVSTTLLLFFITYFGRLL